MTELKKHIEDVLTKMQSLHEDGALVEAAETGLSNRADRYFDTLTHAENNLRTMLEMVEQVAD